MAEYLSKYEGGQIESLLDFANVLKDKLRYWVSPDPTSPAELFGGTWVKIDGKFVLGSDGSVYPVLSTGGSPDAVLPEHAHKTVVNGTGIGENWNRPIAFYATGVNSNLPYSLRTADNVDSWLSTTNNVGVSGTGKNMPPYIALHAWYKAE